METPNERITCGILDAHGGMDRWNGYKKVNATIVSGGGFFSLKGVPQDSNPRRMTVWLHEERSSVSPYSAPDQRTMLNGVVRAVQIAQHVDGPIKVVWTREEDIQHDMYRPYWCDRMSACLVEKGMPVTWNNRFARAPRSWRDGSLRR